jgi:hypothetical protein
MYSNAELQLTYKFANAPIFQFPFPHFFIEDIFPKDFYDELQRNLPDPSLMLPIGEVRPVRGFNERFVLELGGKQVQSLPEEKRGFWTDFAAWLNAGRFGHLARWKFQHWIDLRFKDGPPPNFYTEAMLVEDITKYSLGPHTDSPKKVVTMLFYLPKDTSQAHLGTSIYVPKDPSFSCPGGPHYPFERFMRLHTMPFLPNSLFVFLKSNNSFHGVEPVTDPDIRRWLLLFDVYNAPPSQSPKIEAAPASRTHSTPVSS